MGENLKALSYEYRKNVVDMIMSGKGGHIGGDMSEMEILMQLYLREMNISPENQDDPDRDYFILSKGHAVESFYTVLAHKGFFPLEKVMAEFSHFGSEFIGHPNNRLPGIEMNSGSLGHGLPVAVGLAVQAQRGIGLEELCGALHRPYGEILGAVGQLEADGVVTTDLLRRCSLAPGWE